jgi:hypothetical protein
LLIDRESAAAQRIARADAVAMQLEPIGMLAIGSEGNTLIIGRKGVVGILRLSFEKLRTEILTVID